MLHYLRYRNGCVFLGKYAAYTVSMAFLKAADSTSRSEKQKASTQFKTVLQDEVTGAHLHGHEVTLGGTPRE